MTSRLLQLLQSPSRFRVFLLKKLPAAFFAGIRIESATAESCAVSVPFRWSTQNPFRSTYFACLSMAAEMSTGVLAMNAVYGKKPSVSMLIVSMKSSYHKKAIGKTIFTCSDGPLLQKGVADAMETGAGQPVSVYSRGTNAAGELVAEFWFTWSFKAKSNPT